MAGSRWSADSDLDYLDPRDQHVLCATRGCNNPVTFPAFESVCSKCISMQAEQARIAAALLEAQRLKARLA